jgi:diguanylate cyclase (GGDEF)-like protein
MSNVSSHNSPLILVVDDDLSMRILLRKAMEKEGYQVVEAKDGEECLVLYKRIQPDIVLLDAIMPLMDGFACCAQLQILSRGDCTPILMITGLDDQESVDRAFEVGAIDYVTKPIHWAVLRQRVRRLLQQSQLYKQLESANQALQLLATLDSLTQLANRRRFDEYLDHELRRMAREKAPLSLILCDIDFFKGYNDIYGHQAGDNCLQQVARAISQTMKRPADLVARYGGEEFAVILPNTNAEGAVQIAEKVRSEVNALKITHVDSQADKCLTLSLGVASIIPRYKSVSAILISAADKALYQAKAEGRNTVRLACTPYP